MTHISRFLGIVVLAVFYLAAPAMAANPVYDQNIDEIKKIEEYLNSVQSLRATFVQASSNGNSAQGKVYLARPSKLRFTYDGDKPIELVSDGKNLVYYDGALEQVSYTSIDSSPLAPILKSKVEFNDPKIILTGFEKKRGEISVSFIGRNDPGAGTVTLQFSADPIILKRWLIHDAQDVVTTVSLVDPEIGANIDPAVFKFNDPRPLDKRIDQ